MDDTTLGARLDALEVRIQALEARALPVPAIGQYIDPVMRPRLYEQWGSPDFEIKAVGNDFEVLYRTGQP